jgi:Bacterial capsule synthesis protein PGA_cap
VRTAWRPALLGVLACLPLVVLAPAAPDPDRPPSVAGPAITLTAGSDDGDPHEEGTTTRPRVRSVTLALTGDVLVHDNVWASARRSAGGRGFDFRPMLADLRPRIAAADLALCHLETPLAPADGPFSSYPLFSTPPQVAGALRRLGYDGCTTASNHSVDQGFSGVTRTLDVLDDVGLAHTGTARSPAEAGRVVMLHRHGMSIAWLAATYGTNGMPVEKPWSVELIDVDHLLAQARRARAAGADAVVVALHWGEQYSHGPSAFQRQVAERLTRSGLVDLVYGHHAHVVQPIRRVHGTWVVYGLGNLLAGQGTIAPGVNDGLVVEVTLRQRGVPGDWGRVQVLPPRAFPTHIDSSGPDGEFHVYDVSRALQGRLDPATRAELLASRAATRAALG